MSSVFLVIFWILITSTSRGDSGEEKAWVVQLNISGADHLDKLFDDISKRIENEVTWGIFASALDPLAIECKEYKEILSLQLSGAKKADRALVFGTGSGLGLKEFVRAVSKTTLIEFNAVMREHVLKRLSGANLSGVTYFKQAPHDLRGVLDSSQDFLTTTDGLLRCEDLGRVFQEAHRVLRDDGHLSFLTFHSKTDLQALMRLFKKGLSKKNEKPFKALGELFQKHPSIFTHHSFESIRETLEAAGFSIQTWDDEVLSGQALWVEAVVR